jgi:hypothetical protein
MFLYSFGPAIVQNNQNTSTTSSQDADIPKQIRPDKMILFGTLVIDQNAGDTTV